MTEKLDVAVIGAGPYGLSIAAHLSESGIENRVFGLTMNSWLEHMPSGMFLKSYGESSSLFDPRSELTLETFCRRAGIDYDHSIVPVSLETFVRYGVAFQERFVPGVVQTKLVELTPGSGGHALRFENGEHVFARRVVLAVGVVPFRFVPPVLAKLPAQLLSHSSDFGPLAPLAGKEVAVVGGGASALDMAALLLKQGSKVTLLSRRAQLHFQSEPVSRRKSLLRRMLTPDSNGLGSGWLMTICASAPQVIHALPERARVAILDNYLGPSGGYFVKTQIPDSAVRLGCALEAAEEQGGRAHLTVRDSSGACRRLPFDHVVAATGYRIAPHRLGFLNAATLERLRTIDASPALTRNFESSVPGLHFVGLSSARSFGPVMRFVVGAVHPARTLTRLLRTSRASRRDSLAAAAWS
jgi:hypothetical protein